MADIKNVILQKMVEGVLCDLMVKTNQDNVFMADGRSLAAHMAEYLTAAETESAIDDRINSIVNGAPDAFDTLKEIADYIETHEDAYNALQAAIGNKVTKEEGKGLSEEDFTTALKTKLDGLSNYIHPASHPAAMITEDADHRFTSDTKIAAWDDAVSGLATHTGNSGIHVDAAEKAKIAASGRILMGATAPADLKPEDLFIQIVN